MKYLTYLFFFLFLFSCNDDDNDIDEPCILYRVFISDNCDCNDMDFNCGDLKFITEAEFNRIIDIQVNSTEPCIYIQSEELASGLNFEGFLINIAQSQCDFDINIGLN